MPPKKKDEFIPFTFDEFKEPTLPVIKKKIYKAINLEDNDSLKIIPYKIDKNEQKLPSNMTNGNIPLHPFRLLNSGSSGSGKSMLVLNLLQRRNFMKGFFDEIFLISPTARGDQIQSLLNLDEDHICDTLDDVGIDFLTYIFNRQNDIVEQMGYLQSPKILILFDDVISSPKFLNSGIFKRCFIQGRHINMSSIVNTQKYHAIPRTMRLNCTDITFFPSSSSEVDRIAEEYCPPRRTVSEFKKVVQFATNEPYCFLYINTRNTSRFRKCLTDLIVF
jgi:hypothetical protein